jgi:shikimate kinase
MSLLTLDVTGKKVRALVNQNIILIGMPGAGKSTVGVVLAKYIAKDFIDTDLLIQTRHTMSLQDIVDRHGYLKLRQLEEEEILRMNAEDSVVATGGSAVYSDAAMRHLKKNGTIIYLKNDCAELLNRIPDFSSRGLAKREDQTFDELCNEREPLYCKYSDMTIDCRGKDHEDVAVEIVNALR